MLPHCGYNYSPESIFSLLCIEGIRKYCFYDHQEVSENMGLHQIHIHNHKPRGT